MKNLIQDRSKPLVNVITDRRLLPHPSRTQDLSILIEYTVRALDAGIDILQIREPDLSAREILSLTEAASEIARKRGSWVLVNDRVDVAAGASSGVHLTTHSLPVDVVRGSFGPDIPIGASTHSLVEAIAAERGGADFVVFGPVFETPSKRQYGEPVGIEALRTVVQGLSIPVLGLGGINLSNFQYVLDAGAAGVAGISVFVESGDLAGLVATIKGYRARTL